MRYRLRSRLGMLAAVGAVLLLAAGCGRPPGVDGDLTNGWGAMVPATGFEPKSQTCHGANFSSVGVRGAYEVLDCKLQHRTETVFVGAYAAPAADANDPPTPGSAGAKVSYEVCDQQTSAYVGGSWRNARLWIGVVHPSPAAWSGGARWFRCEVLELGSVEDDGGVVQRAGSLRNALAGGSSDLMLTCYAIQLDKAGVIAKMPGISCQKAHNAEFVGIWQATDLPYPKNNADWVKFHDGCRDLIASYANLPADKDLQYRTGVVSLPGGVDVWGQGDYGVRCYLWLDGAKLTNSLKGAGVKSLPVQYK